MTPHFQRTLVAGLLLAATAPLALAQATAEPQAAAPVAGLPDPAASLPTDPRLVTGTLENGVSYVFRPHANPPGKVSLWMHIGTGSLNETDEQRGLAHFLEHMAFNGSANFPPGEVVKYFESIGLTFGRDQNAFTSFDQTAYQLYLPDAERGTLARGLLFFADVAQRLDLDPGEIESERGIILEERRTDLGPQQRVRDQWLSRLAPGSLIGERLPIGTEATLNTVTREDFLDYYNRWYVPANLTVIVAGDIDADIVVEEIENAFGAFEAGPSPESQDPNVSPSTERRAIVAHDAELTGAQAAIIVVDEPKGGETTQGDLRRGLVDTLMLTAFNRRMQAKVSDGAVRFLSGGAFASDLFSAMHLAQAAANGEPQTWRAMLEDITTETARAAQHGFTEGEFEEAKAQLIAQLEALAQQEATYPVQAILSQLTTQVNAGDALLSPEQTLDAARAWLPDVTAEEISQRFAERFDLDRATFLLTLPTGAGVPEESEVLAIGSAAADSAPEADVEAERAEAILAEKPTAGTVEEITLHEPSGVVSAWLGNGVRVHHRKMTQRENYVDVRITLAAGEIMETADNRGVSAAAAQAWRRPAAKGLTSSQVRSLMAGVKANVSGDASEDAFTLAIQGSPDDLEPAMQLAYRLLTDPVVEQAGFEQWRTETIQGLEAAMQSPQAMLGISFQRAFYPDDAVSVQPLTVEQLRALTLAEAQQWIEAVTRAASIEVAVVGDIEQDAAMELVRSYLGALPPRGRISATTLDQFRSFDEPASDATANVDVETQTQVAGVIAGFYASDADNRADTRALSMASRTLSTRMIEKIREEEQLVYSIQTQLAPGEAVPGFGVMLAGSLTEPAKADTLVARIHEMFAAFAETGPTEEEVETVKKQLTKTVEEALEQPSFWAGQLSGLVYRDRSLDDLVTAVGDYNAMTADDIRDTFRRYYNDRPKVSVVVRPVAPEQDG